MTDIAMEALNRGWNLGFATGKVLPLRLEIAVRYRRWREYRKVVAELRQYSGAEITELGISHYDVERVADHAGRT